MINHLLFVRSS